MNSGVDFRSSNFNSGCGDLMTMAERELSAFFKTVTQLFGPGQAEISAEDWLQELIAMDGLPSSIGELRWITAKASTRLASRVGAALSTEFTIA
jgi:hypothetical protein